MLDKAQVSIPDPAAPLYPAPTQIQTVSVSLVLPGYQNNSET